MVLKRGVFDRLCIILTASALLVGCHGTPANVPQRPSASDPCAERLHDISGHFLLYYSLKGRLPQKLEELRSIAGGDASLSFTCPVSETPYIYDSSGPRIDDPPGFVVVYDSVAAHSGLRWAIIMEKPTGAKPLVTRIVGLAEERWAQLKPAGQAQKSKE